MSSKQTARKLDLGGTACYEDPQSVIIDLDATNAGDETTPLIQADYNLMPFPSNFFDEALGSCYLEQKPNWNELARVMKTGAEVIVKACDLGYAPIGQMADDAIEAGFEVLAYAVPTADDEPYLDGPFILKKL